MHLGIERCGLFLFRNNTVYGTYGTDRYGQTVDERHVELRTLNDWWSNFITQGKHMRWQVFDGGHYDVHTESPNPFGHGWIAAPPLMATAEDLLGVMFNDAAISGTPLDESLQELFVVYCSLLAVCLRCAMALAELRESETRYRILFEHAPNALCETDSSEIKRIFDALRAQGVTNIGAWLAQHPECVADCSRGLRVRTCNNSYLALFDATSPDELLAHFPRIFTAHAHEEFRKQLAGLAEGQTLQTNTTVIRTLRGIERHVVVTWLIMPGCEHTFARTLISIIDTTEAHQHLKQIEAYQEELRALAAELTLAEERERRRIAAALHDDVCQTLAMIKMQLDLLLRAPVHERVNARITPVADMVAHSIQSARSLMFDLSPPMLHELGLVACIEWLAEQLQAEHGVAVSVRVRGADRALLLNETLRTILFLVIRELLLNVMKHAAARAARVTLVRDTRHVIATVTDNGCGFSPDAIVPRNGGSFGLFNVRERLRQCGGTIRIMSRPGRGSMVTVAVPLPASSSSSSIIAGVSV